MIDSGKSSVNNLIWLASYPRSGNTFLRTILWNCFGLKSASIYPQDLGDNQALKDYVGHIDHSENRRIEFPHGVPQLLKTHEVPKNDKPAIYVVRDGRAACASLFKFYNGSIPIESIISGNHRFGSWSSNLEAWAPWNRPNTLLLRYEDLRDDLEASLDKIAEFLGRPPACPTIPPREEIAEKDGRWVRACSSWRDLLDEPLLKQFYRVNGDAMRRLGYECPSLPIHKFDNGVQIFDHHLLDLQRERYKTINLHEPEEEEIFKGIIADLEAGDCYYDVGAAVGYYVILAHKLRRSEIKIKAFEPLPSQEARLAENIRLNKIPDQEIEIYNSAISNADGVASLTDCSYASGIVSNSDTTKSRTIPVETRKLDSILAGNTDVVGLLQVDVQGHELAVLRGASKSLWSKRIKHVLIGTHGFGLHENCIQFLTNRGYRIQYEEYETTHQPDGIIHASIS